MASIEYNATVIQRVEVAPGLIILRVRPDVLPFRFEAGQYTVLGLKKSAPRVLEAEPEENGETPQAEGGLLNALAGSKAADPPNTLAASKAADPLNALAASKAADPDKLIRRAYSIASSSHSQEYVEFYLTLVASGELTPRLFALNLGDRLFVGPKATGLFTLDRVPEGLHSILVATGTGLAPYMSMLRTALICGGPRRFIVLHGARFSWDLGYRAELSALARHCHNLVYLPVLTRAREETGWSGLTGYLQDVILTPEAEASVGFPIRPDQGHVFLCGNPGMIEAVREKLTGVGFVEDRGKVSGSLHVEEYW